MTRKKQPGDKYIDLKNEITHKKGTKEESQ